MTQRARAQVQPGDEGASLVELLAAVTLMGVAMVAILSALGVLISSSREHRQMANAQVVLTSAAELVKGAAYVPCTDAAASSAYSAVAAAAARPSDWGAAGSVSVTSVEFWDGTTFATGTCATDLGLARVSLRVVNPDGSSTDTFSVLKGGVAGGAGGGGGGLSPCTLKNPSVSASASQSTVDVRADALETFKLHLDPNSCLVALPALYLYIPGLPTATPVVEVSNPTSADPTWEVKNLRMPAASTPGWGTIGQLLTAILYDDTGAEAGRFYLEVVG